MEINFSVMAFCKRQIARPQIILDNLEEGRAEDVIIGKLMRRFSLDYDRAMEYFERYAGAAVL